MRALERGALSGSLANFGRYTRASELSVSVSFCTLGASERFYVTLAADGTSDDYPIDATSGLSDATLTIASDDLYEYDYPSTLVAHSTPSVTLALADAEEDDAKSTVGPAIGVQTVGVPFDVHAFLSLARPMATRFSLPVYDESDSGTLCTFALGADGETYYCTRESDGDVFTPSDSLLDAG